MKPNPKAILRWAVVLLSGGFGVYLLGDGFRHAFRQPNLDWSMRLFEVVFVFLFASLPLAAACFAYFRQYRRLARLAVGMGAFVVFAAVMHLSRSLGGDQFLRHSQPGPAWRDALGLVLWIAPLWLTAYLYQRATRLVDRRFPASEPTLAQQARALRWQQRMWPLRRWLLQAGMVLATTLVAVAVLAFLGALVWVRQASGGLDGVDDMARNTFGLGLVVMVGCLLVFLVSLMVRGDCKTQLRAISAARD